MVAHALIIYFLLDNTELYGRKAKNRAILTSFYWFINTLP